jgi:hypothetical protein
MKLKLAASAVILGLTAVVLGACDNGGTGTGTESTGESPAADTAPAKGISPEMSPSPTTSP